MLDEFESSFRDVAKACKAHNLVMPLIACIASPNGSFLAIRIGADDSTVLARHVEGDGFNSPFRIMLIDQANTAVKFTMNGKDDRPFSSERALSPA